MHMRQESSVACRWWDHLGVMRSQEGSESSFTKYIHLIHLKS